MPRIMGSMIEGECAMTVCRTTGGDEDCVTVQIVDGASGCLIVEAHFPLDEYATAALSGFGKGTMEVPKSAPIGFKSEHKTEDVEVPKSATDAKIRKAVAAYEVDGWTGSDSDAKNHHRHVGGPKSSAYTVSYSRYVHPETGEVWKR